MMKFSACFSTRAAIASLAGIGLLLVAIQRLDSPNILPLLLRSITGGIHDAKLSHTQNQTDRNLAPEATLVDTQLERQYSNLSEEFGQQPPSPGAPASLEDRHFHPYGVAAHVFVHVGSYRGGPRTFATVGLASKPLGKTRFDCEWIPAGTLPKGSVMAKGSHLLPDWGFGRIYTVVVVNCVFDRDVGVNSEGGELLLHSRQRNGFTKPTLIPALKEPATQYNSTLFHPPYPYKYLYCGSPLYGRISPKRVREWMAYHMWFFGSRSYFVLYDAGGVDSGVRKILDPWIKLGRVKIEPVREQWKYDGYYYNQFLFVNDCLHKYRFMADWTFFFDIDEYVYVPPGMALDSVLAEYGASQILIQQSHISDKLCLRNSDKVANGDSGEWGFKKLVFRNVKKQRWNRKYVVNARNVFSAGVHLSKNVVGKTVKANQNKLRYYHYHDTISYPGELCREYVEEKNKKNVRFERNPYRYDGSMAALTENVKNFESKLLGSGPDYSA